MQVIIVRNHIVLGVGSNPFTVSMELFPLIYHYAVYLRRNLIYFVLVLTA